MPSFEEISLSNFRGLIDPILFNDEQWKRISDYIPEILSWYWVSNTGKIYSENSGNLLKPDYVGKGYLKVTLQTINGPKDMLIHRVVMLCFEPIENHEEMTVNHKDADHENNFYTNLEWATYTEQMEHASENNLLDNSAYSEEEVRKICEMLQVTPNQDEIIMNLYGNIKFSNRSYYNRIKHLINRIQTKQSWVSVSSQYNILPKTMTNPNQVLTDEQVDQICKILETDPKMPSREVFRRINIDIGNPGDKMYVKLMATLVNIRNKKCFNNITSKYNF